MRSFLKISLTWAPALTLSSIAYMASTVAAYPMSRVSVQEYDVDNAWARLYLSGVSDDSVSEPLVLEVQVPPTDNLLTKQVVVNGQTLGINWEENPSSSSDVNSGSMPIAKSTWNDHSLMIPNMGGRGHNVTISVSSNAFQESVWSRPEDKYSESFIFHVLSVNQKTASFGFSMLVNPQSSNYRLRSIIASTDGGDRAQFGRHILKRSFAVEPRKDQAMPRTHKAYYDIPSADIMEDIPLHELSIGSQAQGTNHHSFDIEAEITSLLALEAEANELQAKIYIKKQAIADHLRRHRDNTSLKHLLHQCDGVMCAAKLIAQRICDKVGISTQPSFKYVKVQSPITQHLLGLDTTDGGQVAKNYTNSKENLKNMTGVEAGAKIDFSRPSDALLTILKLIAGALGLIALFTFLHSKFMPMRKRVERDADREERRNARAYRRAARRANARSRWNTFVRSISCFGSREEPRQGNYDEKRALILQDALLEQELDQAEKGEVMEAEIRQLRNAHELVSSMVRSGEIHQNIVADPPPPLVPLPYTPLARSRASSATLPSYTSEILPSYISRANTIASASDSEGLLGDSSGSDSEIPSLSSDDEDDHFGSDSELISTAPSDVGSRRSRGTILSSLPDIEHYPRISEDTLRTRQSKDIRRSREY